MRLGIVGTSFSSGDEVFGARMDMIRFMNNFGTPEIIYPQTTVDEVLEMDGVFLPGGADVDSTRYGEAPSYQSYRSDQFFEWFDKDILPNLFGKVPLIGICRGLQTINVALGGSLHQHLKNHPYSWRDDDLVHNIDLGSKAKLKVNSYHHQGVKKLATGLVPIGFGPQNLIEAFISTELRVFAVQWHPERMVYDWFSEQHITSLLKGE